MAIVAKAGSTGRRTDGARAASGNGKAAAKAPPSYAASLSGNGALPKAFSDAVRGLEGALDMPIWLLVHNESESMLDASVLRMFLRSRDAVASTERIGLLVDSPGGFAQVAYKIARMLRCQAGGFTIIIPRYAKSAATLLALGADDAIMSDDAEIGPLDAQTYDDEREERGSALDEIQALEQLNQVALAQLDEAMMLMRMNIGKRSDVLLPHACRFVSDMMTPLLEKIDTVHYAKQSRVLKVAEEYATRLLAPTRGPAEARRIADRLVNRYPEHGFIIDRQEVVDARILRLRDIDASADKSLHEIEMFLWHEQLTAFGRVEEVKDAR